MPPSKYTVLISNGMLGTSRYVGTFDDKIAAEAYALEEAARSRKFASFEVWTGTPTRPGRATNFHVQGPKGQPFGQVQMSVNRSTTHVTHKASPCRNHNRPKVPRPSRRRSSFLEASSSRACHFGSSPITMTDLRSCSRYSQKMLRSISRRAGRACCSLVRTGSELQFQARAASDRKVARCVVMRER